MPNKPKNQAEKLAAARAEAASKLDWLEQMEAHYALERAEKQREHNEFMQRVTAMRDAVARGEVLEPPAIPSITDIYAAKAAERQAAEQEAERQRIASLSARDIWMSTLSWSEKQRIGTWEAINKMPYPVPGEAVESAL